MTKRQGAEREARQRWPPRACRDSALSSTRFPLYFLSTSAGETAKPKAHHSEYSISDTLPVYLADEASSAQQRASLGAVSIEG
eukprot:3270651-Prymnesium_polylepis.1